jgi:hypothetical protein
MGIDPAYVAGFLDGEGNITILQRNRYNGGESYCLIVGFTNRDIHVLELIQNEYGGSIFQKRRYKPNHSPSYELRICTRKQTQRILADVLPFLICKKNQAELGLSFLRLGKVRKEVIGRRRFHPTKGGTVPLVRVMPGEQEVRREIKANLSLLNKRGA